MKLTCDKNLTDEVLFFPMESSGHQQVIDDLLRCFISAYWPDLNPDEYLDADWKSGIKDAVPARNQKQLNKTIMGHMRMPQNKPERAAQFKAREDCICRLTVFLIWFYSNVVNIYY